MVDTNVFLYARGAAHPYRQPCRQILTAARDGVIALDASVEIVQEYTHVLLRRAIPRSQALDEADEVARQCRLHAFDHPVLTRSLSLLRRHPALGVRDAVHAATALTVDLDQIISTDRVFDDVDGLTRLDPSSTSSPWVTT
jgi:predicted nucleic acid-binding protein